MHWNYIPCTSSKYALSNVASYACLIFWIVMVDMIQKLSLQGRCYFKILLLKKINSLFFLPLTIIYIFIYVDATFISFILDSGSYSKTCSFNLQSNYSFSHVKFNKNNAALFSNHYGGYLADIRSNGEIDVVYNIVR